MTARLQPISVLARQNFGQNPMPVADRTGLTGTYDFRLEFSVDEGADAHDAKVPPLPDLFAAVREQLGLEFIPKKVPSDVLVIDSFDVTPAEN